MVFRRRFWSIVAIVFLCCCAQPSDCFADKGSLQSVQEEEGHLVDNIPEYTNILVDGVSKRHAVSDAAGGVEGDRSHSTSDPKDPVQGAADGLTSNVCASSDSCYKLGSLALSKRESDRAIQFFDDAIRHDPKNAIAYEGRAQAHMVKASRGEGKTKECFAALKDAREAVKLAPARVFAWVLRAKALRNMGRLDESIVDCEKALTIHPFSEQAYMERGNARKGNGDYEGAISDFSKVIALSKGADFLALGLCRRAGVYVKLGDLVRAEVDCDRAMLVDPACNYAYKVRAIIFAARKEYDRALAEVRKAQDLGYGVDEAFLEELKKNALSS